MEKIVWVVNNNKEELLDAQRCINSTGGMKASVFHSFDALQKQIDRLIEKNAYEIVPSIVIFDYEMAVTDEFRAYSLISENYEEFLKSIPVLFMTKQRSEQIEFDCFSRGAMALLSKPFSESSIPRIEQIAWKFDVARRATNKVEQQSMELKYARTIKELNEQLNARNELLYKTFGMYFNDDVLKEILDGDRRGVIGGRKCMATVMMTDLRGFTTFSQKMDSNAVMEVLNLYFSNMSEIIMKYKGTIIEFLGDGILAVFGAPISDAKQCERAVAAAIEMQNQMNDVRAFCEAKGYTLPEMGIGIHTGEIFIGNIGSEKLMRYNVIGATVNQASRIESCSVGGQVLVSNDTLKNIGCVCETDEVFAVNGKGFESSINAATVKYIGGEYECRIMSDKQSTEIILDKGMDAHIHIINNKIISEEAFSASMIYLSGKRAKFKASGVDMSLFEDHMDVFIQLIIGDRVYEENYGKVMSIVDDVIEVYFTHFGKMGQNN